MSTAHSDTDPTEFIDYLRPENNVHSLHLEADVRKHMQPSF